MPCSCTDARLGGRHTGDWSHVLPVPLPSWEVTLPRHESSWVRYSQAVMLRLSPRDAATQDCPAAGTHGRGSGDGEVELEPEGGDRALQYWRGVFRPAAQNSCRGTVLSSLGCLREPSGVWRRN